MILGRTYSEKGKINDDISFVRAKEASSSNIRVSFFEKSYKMSLSLPLIQNCQLLTDTTNDNQLKSRLRPSKDNVFSFLLVPCLSRFGVYNSVVLLHLSLFQAKIYTYHQTSKARGKWWQNRYILQTNKELVPFTSVDSDLSFTIQEDVSLSPIRYYAQRDHFNIVILFM